MNVREDKHYVGVDSRGREYRADCSCGWVGPVCDHPKTAEADGADHQRGEL